MKQRRDNNWDCTWRAAKPATALILTIIGLSCFSAPMYAAQVPKTRANAMVRSWLTQNRTRRLGKALGANIRAITAYASRGENIFYVAELAPDGLVIISADDLLEPIIAFTDKGSRIDLVEQNPLWALISSDMPRRHGHAASMRGTGRAQQRPKQSSPRWPPPSALKSKSKWARYADSDSVFEAADDGEPGYAGAAGISEVHISPLVQSKWDQKTAQGQACYNYYCPPGPDGDGNNYYAGCVATLMAQLMRFHQSPASAYSHSYDYANMPLIPASGTLTLTHRQQIGRLCRDAGDSVSMNYGAAESSANLLIVDTALTTSFGYSNARDKYRASGLTTSERDLILKTNLAAGLPVVMGIRGSGGHAVLADGFGSDSGTLYYHLNMGWGGTKDLWYNLPIIDAYSTVDVLGYNIFTNGTGEIIAGRVTNTNGDPVNDATVVASSGGASYTNVTDALGYYGIIVPSAQIYTVTADKEDYPSEAISGITVGTSSTSSSGDCGNYWGADIMMRGVYIPTLTEWGMVTFTILLITFGWPEQRADRMFRVARKKCAKLLSHAARCR